MQCSATRPLPELLFRAAKIFQTQLMIKFPRDFSVVTEERWSSYKVKRLQFFLKQNTWNLNKTAGEAENEQKSAPSGKESRSSLHLPER